MLNMFKDKKQENPAKVDSAVKVDDTKNTTKVENITLENQLKKDLEEKQIIIQDYENTLRRLQADFENYIKRSQKEKEDFAKFASSKVLAKLLNIIDDFERTIVLLENAGKSTDFRHAENQKGFHQTDNKEIKQGIEMVHKQFHKILEEEGVKKMCAKGNQFDPYCQEIIDMVEHETKEGIVVEEIQKGYHLHDKVLRTAKVRVSRGSAQPSARSIAEKQDARSKGETEEDRK